MDNNTGHGIKIQSKYFEGKLKINFFQCVRLLNNEWYILKSKEFQFRISSNKKKYQYPILNWGFI